MKRILIFLLVVNFFFISNVRAEEQAFNFFITKKKVDYNKLFRQVLEKVKQEYVEEVKDEQLIEAALEGMLSSLDPHSAFLNEKEYQEMRTSIKGEIGGIGVELTMERGFVKVVSPYEDSPAFKAGIKSGDYVTMIDGKFVKGMTLTQVAEKMRGKPKTKLKLKIYRESTSETLDISLVRDIIKIVPVKTKLVANDVALLRIANFSENVAIQLKREFEKLKEQVKENNNTLKGVILDLRWNPGGLLEQSTEVAELFLEDDVIVTMKGRIPEANVVIKAQGYDITQGLPMVVLINGGTASAPEIVAGALQDNKRALLVGTRTFGKGVAQTVMPIDGGNAIKLTTARYYTPLGKAIQLHGITPDVVVEEAVVTPVKGLGYPSESSLFGHLEGEDQQDQASEQNVLVNPNKKSQQYLSTLDKKESQDFQLLRAIDLVKGMALYSERWSD
jgi:carboxyl-terminal processing protease